MDRRGLLQLFAAAPMAAAVKPTGFASGGVVRGSVSTLIGEMVAGESMVALSGNGLGNGMERNGLIWPEPLKPTRVAEYGVRPLIRPVLRSLVGMPEHQSRIRAHKRKRHA